MLTSPISTRVAPRTCPRFAAWFGARVCLAGAVHPATVLSVSVRGLFVVLEAGAPELPAGAQVGLHMRVPEMGGFSLRARAIYAATCRGRRGFGLLLEPGSDVRPVVEALRAWHEDYTWFPSNAGRGRPA